MKNSIYYLILFISLISLAVSITIFIEPIKNLCGVGGSCLTVQNSSYSSLLGIKLSLLGILFFTFLSFFLSLQILDPSPLKRNIVSITLFVGSIFAISFILLQIFVIKALCKYCLFVDSTTIFNFIIIFIKNDKKIIARGS